MRRSIEIDVEGYELSSKMYETGHTNTPSTALSARSSIAALNVAEPQDGTVQELPPVDRGIKAWTFCAAAFVLEMMVWGFGFRFVYCPPESVTRILSRDSPVMVFSKVGLSCRIQIRYVD